MTPYKKAAPAAEAEATAGTAATATATAPPPVIVVGGGLVGLCCAYYLRKAGAEVTVLERGTVGGGASRYNAGEITSGVSPLPAPGVPALVWRDLFKSASPIHASPLQLVRGARFFTGFARHCTADAHAAGLAALTALNVDTYALFDELAAEGVVTTMRDGGYLMLANSEESAQASREHYGRKQNPIAPPTEVFTYDELHDLEPALAPDIRYGFLRPLERWFDPSAFIDGLADALRAAGVRVVEEAEVVRVRETPGSVVVLTTAGEFEGSEAVLAAGVWTEDLCRGLGIRLGIQPGKGYSFTVPVDPVPQRLLQLCDHYVAIRPEGDHVRVGGTMELDGTRDGINPARLEAMVKAVRRYLPGAGWDRYADEWVAPRPMTLDGLPFIGRPADFGRIIVAAGHNMLGATLAPATGLVVTDLVLGREPSLDLAPFALGRPAW